MYPVQDVCTVGGDTVSLSLSLTCLHVYTPISSSVVIVYVDMHVACANTLFGAAWWSNIRLAVMQLLTTLVL